MVFWSIVATVAAVVLAILGIPQAYYYFRKLREQRSQPLPGFAIHKARNFDPSVIVNAYGVHGFRDYWPIEADAEISEALRNRNHILLAGRPHVGKTRAAAHHIKKYFGKWWSLKHWYVIVPNPQAIDEAWKIRIPKRRYVLLLDDLDHYLTQGKTTGIGPLSLIQEIRTKARELIVIATMRGTGPEFDAIASTERLLDRWCRIEIRDWSHEKGALLAKTMGANLDAWDGTPLSVIQPSPLMAERYRKAALPQKKILRLLKLFISLGFSFVPRRLLLELSKEHAFHPETDEATDKCSLDELKRGGFLSPADQEVTPYHRYVEIIDDWEVEPSMLSTLKNVLVKGKWNDQLLILGSFLARKNNLQGAREAYEAAVQLDPTVERHHYRLGVILLREKKWAEAEQALRSAIRLSKGWHTAWYRLARVLREQGKEDEALDAFTRARSLGSDDPQVRLHLAAIYRLEGRPEEAVEELTKVLEDDKKNAEAWQELGRALRDVGQWDKAINAHSEALRLKPDWSDAWFGLAEPLRKRGETSEAEKAYRKAIELGTTQPEIYGCLGALLHETGKQDEAEEVLRVGIKKFPANARLYSLLGSCLSGKRRHEEAMRAYEKALEYQPSYAMARVGLACSQRNLQKQEPRLLEKAIENNKLALEADPELGEAHFGLGLCYLNKGSLTQGNENVNDFRLADRSFLEATRLQPDYAPAYYHRAIAISRYSGSLEKAIECLEKARKYGYDSQKVNKWQKTIQSRASGQ